MRLHLLPCFVEPLHLVVVAFSPDVDAALDTILETVVGGLQILHGKSPISPAFDNDNALALFLTMRQSAAWYFSPDGVL